MPGQKSIASGSHGTVTETNVPVVRKLANGRVRYARGEGARLRQDILDSASALLAESGDPAQISIRGVARKIGITPMSVYLHFPDVDSLILAVADEFFTELNTVQEAAASNDSDPLDILVARCR